MNLNCGHHFRSGHTALPAFLLCLVGQNIEYILQLIQ